MVIIIEKILSRLGFSDYKKRAYISLLKLKKATPFQVAKASKIPTSKVYEVLGWLYDKGYIVQISSKPVLYEANNPRYALGTEVQTKIHELESLRKDIEEIKTDIEVVEKGTFSIINGYENFFKKIKELTKRTTKSSIGIVQNWKTDKEILDLEKDAIKRGVDIRYLGPLNQSTKEFVLARKKFGVKIRNYSSPTTRFAVWDGKIVMISIRKDQKQDFMSLWIENEVLSKIFEDYFTSLWEKSG